MWPMPRASCSVLQSWCAGSAALRKAAQKLVARELHPLANLALLGAYATMEIYICVHIILYLKTYFQTNHRSQK